MNLQVIRTDFTALSTVGELLVNGEHFCYTLEPPKRDEKPCAITLGTYDVTIRWSEKHKRLIPHVERVPGFDEIEIHIGNFPKDTEGCLLVGNTKGLRPDLITGSRVAFDDLFHLLADAKEAGEKLTITYTEKAELLK